eukprot:GFUD01031470.1.p1 GENE.GFUD01031470.1~~GFUD01031470.1.p1  ORF type:complete len:472 (+),score=80.71 GFUD01031470.1:263-1678(+)
MASITDAEQFATGGVKFSFACSKRTFSMLVSPYFTKFTENLICEEMVLKMGLTIFNRKCETISISGIKTEAVGVIHSTVQCLQNGVQCGTMNIKARVVRDFYKLFSSDGLCGEKLRLKLSDTSHASAHDNQPTLVSKIKIKKNTEPTKTKPFCAWASPPPSPAPIAPPNPAHSPSHTTSSPAPSRSSSVNTSVCSSNESSVCLDLYQEQLQQAWSRQNGDHARWDSHQHMPVDRNWLFDKKSDTWYLPSFIPPDPADYDVDYIDCQSDYFLSYRQVLHGREPHPLSSAQVTDGHSVLIACVPGQPSSNVISQHWFPSVAPDVPAPPVQVHQLPAAPTRPVHHLPPAPVVHDLLDPSQVPTLPLHQPPAPQVQRRPATPLVHHPPLVPDDPSPVPTLPGRHQAAPSLAQGLLDSYIKPFINHHQPSFRPTNLQDYPNDAPPPLPPDFQLCGPSCAYAWCQCLRGYYGRDWTS